MLPRLRFVFLLAGLIALAVPVSAARSGAGTYKGPAQNIGNGQGYSWVTLNDQGEPSSYGLTLSETALSGLPTTDGSEYRFTLPKQGRLTQINHIGVNWNPNGHPPTEFYSVPHFDFHFYLVSPEARASITDDAKSRAKTHVTPFPEYVPTNYLDMPGSEVPNMGAHFIDPASPEFNGQSFTQTFIYGFNNGRMAFLEPMITKAFLETHPDSVTPLKHADVYRKPGYYPSHYHTSYNAATQEYTVALEGLSWK